MPVQPKDMLARLRDTHVQESLTRRQRQVWVGLVVGMSDDEMALALKLASETVRNHIINLEGKLFHGAGFTGGRTTAVALFWLHTGCCTRRLLESIESGEIFVGNVQTADHGRR